MYNRTQRTICWESLWTSTLVHSEMFWRLTCRKHGSVLRSFTVLKGRAWFWGSLWICLHTTRKQHANCHSLPWLIPASYQVHIHFLLSSLPWMPSGSHAFCFQWRLPSACLEGDHWAKLSLAFTPLYKEYQGIYSSLYKEYHSSESLTKGPVLAHVDFSKHLLS